MAENKNSFIAYCDWGVVFDNLSDEEAGRLAKHLFDYVRDKNPNSDRATNLLFISIQQSLKRDLKKYDDYIAKQKENGRKGGRPKNPTEPKKPKPFSENPNKPKKADNVSDSDSVNVSGIPFTTFWNLYDKKTDKPKCEKKWNRLSLEVQQKIIDYIPKYKISQPDKQYRKNPMTFLNNESWENELISPTIETQNDIYDY